MSSCQSSFHKSAVHRGVRSALGWRSALATFSAVAGAALTPALAQAQQTADSSEIETVVVTGRRAALENATERKKNSESIIDSVVADEAGMLPDNSITEVLQRVAGVTIVRFSSLNDPDHFSAEGSGIQVRGLSGVAGRLNGREVFSARDGRGLSWGDVTPELMSAVDVYKTSTADLIEGGTGGQIDLRTKVPFDYEDDFNLNASASLNYGDLAEDANPGASVLIGKNWDVGDGRFGILADLAYNEYSSNADFFRMEPFQRTRIGSEDRFIPGGFDFGNDAYDRARKGAYVAIQWAPNDSLTLTQTAFYSRYDETRSGNGVFATSQNLAVDPAEAEFDDRGFLVRSDNVFQRDNATFLPSGATIGAGGNTQASENESETLDLSTEIKWQASERLGVKGALQWVDSSSGRKSYDVFPSIQFPTSFAIDLSGDLPQVRLPSGSNDLTNGSVTTWQAVMDNLSDNEGDLFAANLDFDFSISDEGFFRALAFGARYADRSELDVNSGFNWQPLGVGWNGDPPVAMNQSQAGDAEVVDWDNFFRGDLNLPGAVLMPSQALANRYDIVRDHDVYGGSVNGAYEFVPTDRTKSSTVTTAAYLLTRFDAGDHKVLGMGFKGNVGLRWVQFENESIGHFTQNQTSFQRNGVATTIVASADDVSGSTKTTKVLPAVNFSFLPSETTHIRLAYNVTLDQPGFNILNAAGSLSVDTEQVTPAPALPTFRRFTTNSGNPYLKPVISHNTDLAFEWYPNRAASAHLALFHKSLDNWFTYGQTTQPVQVTYSAPTAETVTEYAEATNVFNSPVAAKIKGVEVGGRIFFDKLPSPWDGIGIEANYTYIDSENPGDLYYDIDGIERHDAPVQGLSDDNYNITAMYEKNSWSMRLAYSWRSKYLQSTNSNGTNGSYNYFSAPGVSTPADIALPVYGDAYGQLDFGTTWRANEHFSLSLEFNNLTNEITRTLQGGYPGGSNIRSWYVSDRRANLSMRYNF